MIPILTCIEQAYRMAGVLKAPGRGLSNSEQDEGLHILNAMLDGLKIERCFVYQVIRTIFEVLPTQQEYSVGSLADGADWVIERPEKILRSGFLVPATSTPLEAEIPMEVIRDYTQWYAIVTKAVTSSQPRVLYYRATLPTGTALVWPIPSTSGRVTLYTPGTVQEFDDIMQEIEFPKGYREFVEYNLAVQVHDRYPNMKMLPSVEARAIATKSRVMANQLTPLYIQVDEAAMQNKPADGRRWFDCRTWFN